MSALKSCLAVAIGTAIGSVAGCGAVVLFLIFSGNSSVMVEENFTVISNKVAGAPISINCSIISPLFGLPLERKAQWVVKGSGHHGSVDFGGGAIVSIQHHWSTVGGLFQSLSSDYIIVKGYSGSYNQIVDDDETGRLVVKACLSKVNVL
ncbi:hypothetical protein IPH92_01335 [Candidatus Kaiserbacteria bacterium]|nr:MAG: hypothetical protein IPH92_01335 [Candidatus Kaiserbacteria bacterium]